MIFGIGTDIVQIDRIKTALSAHGDRFAQRILSETEFARFTEHAQPARFLAKRFAAKEAVAKAFGTGFSKGLSLQHIQVQNDAVGRPILHFVEVAQAFIDDNGITSSHLSLSDERDYALAFVILEKVV